MWTKTGSEWWRKEENYITFDLCAPIVDWVSSHLGRKLTPETRASSSLSLLLLHFACLFQFFVSLFHRKYSSLWQPFPVLTRMVAHHIQSSCAHFHACKNQPPANHRKEAPLAKKRARTEQKQPLSKRECPTVIFSFRLTKILKLVWRDLACQRHKPKPIVRSWRGLSYSNASGSNF